MSTDPCKHIDFDAWAALAARDPQAFEQKRAELLEAFLQHVPAERRPRLQRLQWRIDRTRELAPNPLSACVQISQMMWDSLLGDGGLLDALEQLDQPRAETRPQARVLAFQRPSQAVKH